jgi:hypothetical protein
MLRFLADGNFSRAGPPAGTAEAVWGLHRDGPPPVAETLRPAEEGDVLEVSWGGRTGRSRQVVACVGSHRSEALGSHPGSLSGLRGGLRPTHRSVDKPSGQRAHIERWHNTVRQRFARYVRKTLAFSQSLAFHEVVTRWFVTDSNLGLLLSVTS